MGGNREGTDSGGCTEALRAANVDVQCSRYDGMTHGFNNRIGLIDAAKDAVDEAAARISRSFGAG